MSGLQRVNILLEPDQYRALREIAQHEGRSMSALMRGIVRRYLVNYPGAAPWSEERHATEELEEIRDQIRRRHGLFRGDLLEEIREDQDNDLDQVWRAEWPESTEL